ncbi:hypothetical protein EVB94_244 [Rhizobium phage RHph_TM40]|uniref:Uncharacterized protein n=2 Tax=Cuauhnahuacvirus TaxID=3044696 RepID=A0A7S5R878_9CAUD|nr:hypothetical protein PQC16_gp244 [Rhizobium phage RHph_TM30]YP_010671393.1 hypothetical protein PQC17_gp244 [Rhizobium phage RHph_Y65]QIG71715.1 hypothetical protein EVB94_244 [Rhizobium phage RHph_TM40]QIG72078.1 hypothetical protein EVB95_244 [Rhizobium phage RHph_TM2_3B]QIG71351.1 hypothetical protein EVB93_244 [Rhizobium phage RHph_TM30]QIG72802.1 hypothetical protein EVB97_244 [Rhizobium phage RHph_Y65]
MLDEDTISMAGLQSSTTMEIVKKVLRAEDVETRDLRAAIISVYGAVNQLYDMGKKITNSKMTTAKIRKDFERALKGVEVGFNIPIEVRLPNHLRGDTDVTEAVKSVGGVIDLGPVVSETNLQ